MQITVRVPANSRATVYLPGAKLNEVREGKSQVAKAGGVTRSAQTGDDVVVEIGSGKYDFTYDAAALAAHLKRTASQ
jgi:alpha-L-rhamnosidase